MFKDKINLILVIFLIIGISLLLYPSIADYWNASRSTRIISDYNESIERLSQSQIEEKLEEAKRYNEKLLKKPQSAEMSEEELKDYYNTLNLEVTEVMATVEIPSINVRIPIYHGTKDKVLQSAVGHIEWTSLPVGGKSTHSVITGHRGLVSARLFTDLDQLYDGDIFNIYVLGKKLTYQVDEITIVEPHEINNILIQPEKDYVTLLTCTPYGINTHRLLVRGKRVGDELDMVRVSAEAVRVRPIIIASIITVPAALIMGLLVVSLDTRRKERNISEKLEN